LEFPFCPRRATARKTGAAGCGLWHMRFRYICSVANFEKKLLQLLKNNDIDIMASKNDLSLVILQSAVFDASALELVKVMA
jgi:uncharacterized pyridoxamine 5'-phosphate oxidase family protein